jgi:gliding-associated putative ABC transporter substrate-binding component GldG
LAWLNEGRFQSLYKNRFLPAGVDTSGFATESKPTKIIVIADGDIALNLINPQTGQAQPLGFDPFTETTYANEDVLMNSMQYLLGDEGLILTRAKEIQIRPLDQVKIEEERVKWQVINLLGPIVLIVIFGLVKNSLRRRRYAAMRKS